MTATSIDLFHLSPLPMWILDIHTQVFLEVNQSATEFYGYSREAFLKMTLSDVDLGEIETYLNKPIRKHKTSDNGIVYVNLTLQPIHFLNTPAQLIIVSDLSESIESEQRMQVSAQRFSILSKATSDTIWEYCIEKDSMVWNRGIKGVFGHGNIEENTTSLSWWYEQMHPDDRQRVAEKLASHLQDKVARWHDEYRFKCGNGTYKHVYDRGFLIFDAVGVPVRIIGAMRDITDSKLYIEAIEDNNKKFKEIAFIQSHMVRAPLARIMALVDLIRIDPHDADYETLLGHLSSSAKELDAVIINMSDKMPAN